MGDIRHVAYQELGINNQSVVSSLDMSMILNEFSFIYFVYGLAFFSMGLTILVEILRAGIEDARDLLPLAVFGIVHGSHEWLEIALYLENIINGGISPGWEIVRNVLLAFSFASLIGYGVRVLSAQSRKYMNDFVMGSTMLVIYVIAIFFAGAFPSLNNTNWVIAADTMARFILASPGALITSLAISFQARDFLNEGRDSISQPMRWAGIGFGLYGLTQFLGPVLKLLTETQNLTSGIVKYPIPTIRAILAILITLSIIRMTQSLELERRHQLEKAQQDRMEALEAVQREMQIRNDLRKELLRRTVILQEEDRTRISRALHDDTAQILTAFNANLATLKLHVPDEKSAQTILDRLSDLSDQMSDSIYKMVKDLRPAQLDELGIHAALEALILQDEKYLGLKIDFQYNEICERLDPVLETVIYRIVQESLTNTARYAESGEVEVRLIADDNQISIEIEDQGKGFDPDGKLKAGFGLMGLEERTKSLGGQFTVSSAPNQGTTISAVFSIDEPCAKEGVNG